MMATRTFITLVVLLFAATCIEASDRFVLEANFDRTLPSHLEVLSTVGLDKDTEEMVLSIALRNQNLDQLSAFLADVSNPRSENYGHYLSWKEVGDMVAPSDATLTRVSLWLKRNNVHSVRPVGTGDFLEVTLTVSEAEKLLDTTFVPIKTRGSVSRTAFRALVPYSVPASLADDIDFIGGVHGYVSLKPQSVHAVAASSNVTPDTVKQYTNSEGVVGTAVNNTMAVAEFLNQYYSASDLSQFQSQYNLLVDNVASVVGPNDDSDPGLEAQLDIEYIMAAGQGIATWFVSTAGRHQLQEPFLTWLQDMESTPDAPWIHSVSFGDVESTISPDYASRCDSEFEKFGATGRTIFFASGDDGVGCKGCPDSPVQQPNWPATSEFVTAVGGIKLNQDGTLQGDTIATGGFSNLFDMPSYQLNAVSAYMEDNQLPDGESYNVNGRAVPDIAAFSEGVQIVVDGKTFGIGGTSCAAPMVAGIFALLNDLRMQNNMPTIGFVNPWLYQLGASTPDAFVDITSGINTNQCCVGFEAAQGWDPITGWGLPNYETLSQYVLQM